MQIVTNKCVLLLLKSLFSVGATGTLVFGLASKDVAAQLISGLTLHLSDKMYEVRSQLFHIDRFRP